MKITNNIKKVWNFFGFTNVDCKPNNFIVILIKNRKEPIFYIFNICAVLLILLFSLLFISNLSDPFFLFPVFIFICLFFVIYFFVRLKGGDTVIATGDGLEEVNWLFSKFIRWGSVSRVRINTESEFLKKYRKWCLPNLNLFSVQIEAGNKKIFINSEYSNLDKLVEYLRFKLPDKVEE